MAEAAVACPAAGEQGRPVARSGRASPREFGCLRFQPGVDLVENRDQIGDGFDHKMSAGPL